MRLKQEEKEAVQRIKQELESYEKREYERQRNMEEFIQHETKAMENRIDLKDLEKALDEPKDYEFAIDITGHIYRGRETKSIAVPVEERERKDTKTFKRK